MAVAFLSGPYSITGESILNNRGTKSGASGGDGYAVQTGGRGGSELLIFVRRRRADNRGLSLSFVVRQAFTQLRIRLSEWIISPLRFDMHPRAVLSFLSRFARSSC